MPIRLPSPALADPVQRPGASLRFESELPARLRELATLIMARVTTAQHEWIMRRPLAERAGITPRIIATIAVRATPPFPDAGAVLAHDIAMRPTHAASLDEAVFGRGLARFGETGLVDLVVLSGYDTIVAMTLNAFGADLPEGTPLPLPP
ncbi:MAG: carboxymuconolactone decarboxylase family protein [Acetobacteraceae bacterium]